MRIYNVRRPLGPAQYGTRRWASDSRGNDERTVWARSRAEAETIGDSLLAGSGRVVVRTGRLALNPELYQAPNEPRELRRTDYKGWTEQC
jgi:hypothetical protein